MTGKTPSTIRLNTGEKRTLRAFLLELFVYAIFVTGYVLIVLRYLSHWLEGLFLHQRLLYATVALLLMILQAVGLEIAISLVFRFIRKRT